MNSKINLLVITGLFPRNHSDISGIFILDYLKSVDKFCNITVFNINLCGHKALIRENIGNIKVFRYALVKNEAKQIFKPFLYLAWFFKSWQIGKKFENIDIIHVHKSSLYGIVGLLLSKTLKVPVVITEHTNSAKLFKNKIIGLLTKIVYKNADAVLAVSNDVKQKVLDASNKYKRLYVTYNPVDTIIFNVSDSVDLRKAKNIISIGRLIPNKGIFCAVKAFNKIVEKYPKWKYTIIGDGPDYHKINAFIQDCEFLSDKVILKGQLTKKNISYELKNASFFILPSENETFGIAIAEAMASGLPVIVGDETASTEFVNNKCGILVSAKDIEAITKSMKYMIEHLSNYDSNYIRKQIVKKYSFDVFGQRLIKIYLELIQKNI